MDVKVHRIVLLVVDHDNLGIEDVKSVLESTRYPNRCIAPKVMQTETREVRWSDEHPLNASKTRDDAFYRLFHCDVTKT